MIQNVYFGIKYYPDNSNRETIEAFEKLFLKHGFNSYCVARDLEKWGAKEFSPQELMEETFSRISSSDLAIIDVTEKGIGLGIEAGYAKAKGIRLIVTAQDGAEISTTILGIADEIVRYDRVSDILFKDDFWTYWSS